MNFVLCILFVIYFIDKKKKINTTSSFIYYME